MINQLHTQKAFQFYHKDIKCCIYTWNPTGIISWEKEDEDDQGETDIYTISQVEKYIKEGTWVVVTEGAAS